MSNGVGFGRGGATMQLGYDPMLSSMQFSESGFSPESMSTGAATPGQGSPLTAGSGFAPLVGSTLLSSIPPLAVLNGVVGGVGLFLQYQAAKRQYEQQEKARQQQATQFAETMAFNREQLGESQRQYDTSRQDQLAELFRQKMNVIVWQNPVLREQMRRMNQAKIGRLRLA